MKLWLVLVLLPCAALAQPALTADDFIRQAAEDNIADVEAGRLAQLTATVPPSVQQLSRELTGNAMRLNEKLSKLAGARALPLANQIPGADRLALERLSKLQGPAFAREYLRYVLADLEHDRAFFQVASSLDDPAVSQLAKDALPGIEGELRVARALYDAQVAGVPE